MNIGKNNLKLKACGYRKIKTIINAKKKIYSVKKNFQKKKKKFEFSYS